MDKIGIYSVPVIISAIVLIGAVKKTDIFDCFKEGAKEGIRSLISIAPALIGLIIGVNMISASGFFEIVTELMSPLCELAGIPPQVLPLGLIRPVSGSGATAVLSSILEENGADSLIGKTASVMAGSTETTFYAIAVYYGAAGIKKTRYTIPAALAADFFGMISACIVTKYF